MTQRYSGLVVGGPLDGQMIDAEFPRYVVPMMTAPSEARSGLPERPTFSTVTYLYQDGIWFPSELSFGWAMNQLMETYARGRRDEPHAGKER